MGEAAEGSEGRRVERYTGDEILIAATRQARAILTRAEEVNFLPGPGRGVILIKLTSPEDRVLGFVASVGDRDLLTVETSRGAEQTISTMKYEVTGRGGTIAESAILARSTGRRPRASAALSRNAI